jgi:hypothetical protein
MLATSDTSARQSPTPPSCASCTATAQPRPLTQSDLLDDPDPMAFAQIVNQYFFEHAWFEAGRPGGGTRRPMCRSLAREAAPRPTPGAHRGERRP